MNPAAFFQPKHYLTGIDWIIHALDHITRKKTGVGNLSQFVLELDGKLSQSELRRELLRFIGEYPVLRGRRARNYLNLAPFWRIPSRGKTTPLSLNVINLEEIKNPASFLDSLTESVNLSFNDSREHIAFHLIHAGGKSFLAATFDHCLFDARGAEAFLDIFQQEWEEKSNSSRRNPLPEPSHLCQWREKFESGRQVNRTFLWLAENAPPRFLQLPPETEKPLYKFKLIQFDQSQTAAIIKNAYEEAGYLLLMPYLLSAVTEALHNVFVGRDIVSSDYVIPVSIDPRPTEKIPEEIFFNHLSFFFFRIKADEVENFSTLLDTIKKQMYSQVKTGLPRALQQASFLMRIVPLPLLSYLLRLHLKDQIASFSFSYMGESAYRSSQFMGEKVKNVFHMPRVPVPPGLGIFFNQYRGKLNGVLSYLEGMLSDDEVDMIVKTLRDRLGV